VSEIANACSEQAIDAQHISEGIAEIDAGTKINSEGAEQSASTSQNLADQADTLREMLNLFTLEKTAQVNY